MTLPNTRQAAQHAEAIVEAIPRIITNWPIIHHLHHTPPTANSDDPPGITTGSHSDPTGATIERNATSRHADNAHHAARLLREARDAAIGAAAAIDRILNTGHSHADHLDHYCTHCSAGPLPPRSLRNGLCQPCNMYHRRTGTMWPQHLIDKAVTHHQ